MFRRSGFERDRAATLSNVRLRPHRARIEALEPRCLLAVSVAEYASISATYADFGLPADMAQVSIIEIAPDQLSVANLKSAIAVAGATTLPDLIVLRTTPTLNAITYLGSSDELTLDIPGAFGAISIVGFGANRVTLDAAEQCRVMSVGPSASDTTVNLGGVNIQNGRTDYAGGGISQLGGTLRLEQAIVRGNQTGEMASAGGGLYLQTATVTLTNVAVYGNSATDGGGLYLATSNATVTNVTVSANTSLGNGGGMYQEGGSIRLNNTIIARNTAGYGPDLYRPKGAIVSRFSLYGDGTGSRISLDGLYGNRMGTEANPIDPKLSPSGDPFAGFRPLAGSPAIDAGSRSYLPIGVATDLYGLPRVQGAEVDIGAYEFDLTTPTVTGLTVNDGSAQRSMVTKLQLGFSEPVMTFDDYAVHVVARSGVPVGGVYISVANPSGDRKNWELTFSGAATLSGSLPDGSYRLVVNPGGIEDTSRNAMAGSFTQRLFRLFGDFNGDRVVNGEDLVAMRNALGRSAAAAPWFDCDGNGAIDINDLRQLRPRLRRALL